MEDLNRKFFERALAIELRESSDCLLTDKESMIASYLVCGYTVSDIARRLCRSKNTIKIHIRNMKKKCECKTQFRLGVILQNFIKNNPRGYINTPLGYRQWGSDSSNYQRQTETEFEFEK